MFLENGQGQNGHSQNAPNQVQNGHLRNAPDQGQNSHPQNATSNDQFQNHNPNHIQVHQEPLPVSIIVVL